MAVCMYQSMAPIFVIPVRGYFFSKSFYRCIHIYIQIDNKFMSEGPLDVSGTGALLSCWYVRYIILNRSKKTHPRRPQRALQIFSMELKKHLYLIQRPNLQTSKLRLQRRDIMSKVTELMAKRRTPNLQGFLLPLWSCLGYLTSHTVSHWMTTSSHSNPASRTHVSPWPWKISPDSFYPVSSVHILIGNMEFRITILNGPNELGKQSLINREA